MSEIIQGQAEINRAFADLHENIVAGGKTIAKKFSDAYVFEIQLVQAIDTGRLLQSIDWRNGEQSQDLQQYVVDSSRDSSVTYAGFVEGGTKFMAARYPAKRAIEKTDLKTTFDAFVEDAFGDSAI